MRDKRNLINLITVILFILCLALPIFFANYKNNQISEMDNQALIDLSQLGTKDTFTKDFESYVTNRIGFRSQAIDAYQYANDRLFGILTHPNYRYGKDGYVYFNMPKEQPDEQYLTQLAKYIRYMQNYCNKHGISFLYCINPNKTQVYDNHLPDGANLTFTRQKYLIQELDRLDVNYMDNTPLLKENAKTIDVFNPKYDAGHWNETGAYIGMTNILKKLKEEFPVIPVNTSKDYTTSTVTNENLPLSNFKINEETTVYTRNNPQAVDVTANDTDIILDENYRDYTHYVNPVHPEYPKILVFRGSYFLGKEKFMNESFSESVFVHSYYNIFNLEYYVERFKPDIVLFESVEYATINRYFPGKLLKKKIQ